MCALHVLGVLSNAIRVAIDQARADAGQPALVAPRALGSAPRSSHEPRRQVERAWSLWTREQRRRLDRVDAVLVDQAASQKDPTNLNVVGDLPVLPTK